MLQENWDLRYVYVKTGFVDFQISVPEGKDSFIHTVYFVTFKLFGVDCEQNIDMKANFLA